ncbi:ATPase H(+)-transporting accessory protein 2 [Amyelois transitella]|uniref:ATPase H(+)-transporting accessory protein 2 n=1 Tax=Amyelois transitella TaxID=680683 RepID=UPI00298FA0D1|nr:ATPase H(+)-transporting accessory protein 2 [Amyelois transitella]
MTVSHLFSNKMAVKMVLFWISLVLSILGSNASGELSILYSPSSLKFSGGSELYESFLKEIYSASLGLSVEESSQWDGMYISDPFSTPEAVVEVYIDGATSLTDAADLNSKNFPLKIDEFEPDSYEALRHRIHQHYQNNANNVVKVNLSDKDQLAAYHRIFGEIQPVKPTRQNLEYLKYNIEEDAHFLSELEMLKALTEKIDLINTDNLVDFYSFRFLSLHALSDFHGPYSPQTKEAKKLLGDALIAFSKAFSRAYDGSVLVAVVTSDVAHTRRMIRSTNMLRSDNNSNITADSNFSAIFNIILWFSIVFAFSLVAIVYAIMDMDPGRDSIIYRMTSTRMKKDN